ncbi:MAG: hypothetical protein ACOCR6_01860 [archaeon]
MVKQTTRDRVWITVLQQMFRETTPAEAVRAPYVAEIANVSERTARDTLRSMPFAEQERMGDGRVRYRLDHDWFRAREEAIV